MSAKPFPALVEQDWLLSNLDDVTVLDASYHMARTNRDANTEFRERRILGAQRFDIDQVCDESSALPHMIPSTEDFGKAARRLGLSNDRAIVVYANNANYFGATRCWWMLRMYGLIDVGVLQGGFSAWTGPTESGSPLAIDASDFQPQFNSSRVCDIDDVVRHSKTRDVVIVDARGKPRFEGTSEEPRPGMRRGHIPGSLSTPYREFIDENGRFLEKEELRKAFVRLGVPLGTGRNVVVSCGSGVSACNVALALYVADGQEVAVYDGSWSEYGQSNHPVETGAVNPEAVVYN